jgi:isoprenylcysteine carboxyl methyltransferase (ICMT) family protein YpbQ
MYGVHEMHLWNWLPFVLGTDILYWIITRQPMYIQRNIEALACNHCCDGKSNKYYIFWVCVCILRFQCASYCQHLWSVRLCSIFPHYLIKGRIFWKTVFEHKMCVLISPEHSSEKFLILRRISEIWCNICVGLHIKYTLFLSDLNEAWIFSTDFQKITKY